MPSITLDEIVQAADRKYGPFVVEGVPGGDVTLLNAIRLPREKRQKLNALQDLANGDDVEAALDGMRDVVYLVAKTKAEADRLLKAFGSDQAQLAALLNAYGAASQQGEA